MQLICLVLTQCRKVKDKHIQAELIGHSIMIVILHYPVTYNRLPIILEILQLQCQPAKIVIIVDRTRRVPCDVLIVKHLKLTVYIGNPHGLPHSCILVCVVTSPQGIVCAASLGVLSSLAEGGFGITCLQTGRCDHDHCWSRRSGPAICLFFT